MSNSNTPPKPSQSETCTNKIPPGSNSNPISNKPSLTLCTESYKPQQTSKLMVCFDSIDGGEKYTTNKK